MFQPKRDWYVVEWRAWDHDSITRDVFTVPHHGFDHFTMRSHGLILKSRTTTSATLQHLTGYFASINQTVFEELAAARLFFQRQRELLEDSTTFGKLYLWRTVAASRRRAVVLPPLQYGDREAELLMSYPRGYVKPMQR